MGSVTLSLPTELGLAARDAIKARVLVETGTYRGGTTEWAAANFGEVRTVEMHGDRYVKTKAHLGGLGNVRFYLGDSRVVLPHMVDGLSEAAVFWLDAHWCGNYELSVGTPGECPLAEELKVFRARDFDDVVLIDDARLFNSPPPRPHDPMQWPTMLDILIETGHWRPYVKMWEYKDVFVLARAAAMLRIREVLE